MFIIHHILALLSVFAPFLLYFFISPTINSLFSIINARRRVLTRFLFYIRSPLDERSKKLQATISKTISDEVKLIDWIIELFRKKRNKNKIWDNLRNFTFEIDNLQSKCTSVDAKINKTKWIIEMALKFNINYNSIATQIRALDTYK